MDAQNEYQTLADRLVSMLPVTQSRMFSMPCLKTSQRKAFAGFTRDSMVFKLNQPEHARALALAGAHLFDPGGMGRPMKEWVVVPASNAEEWEDLAQAAFHYVDGLG
jgi:hypothetical protein